VLRWKRKQGEQAEALWDSLAATNTEIFDCIEQLNTMYRVWFFYPIGLCFVCVC
jgi:hypothetical protein